MHLLIACLALMTISCSSVRRSADFSAAETNLNAAIEISSPEAKKHLIEVKKQFVAAKEACNATSIQLDDCVREKNELLKEAQYWKAKQRKALKELWIWRGGMLVLGLFALRGPIFWVIRKFIGIPW